MLPGTIVGTIAARPNRELVRSSPSARPDTSTSPKSCTRSSPHRSSSLSARHQPWAEQGLAASIPSLRVQQRGPHGETSQGSPARDCHAHTGWQRSLHHVDAHGQVLGELQVQVDPCPLYSSLRRQGARAHDGRRHPSSRSRSARLRLEQRPTEGFDAWNKRSSWKFRRAVPTQTKSQTNQVITTTPLHLCRPGV